MADSRARALAAGRPGAALACAALAVAACTPGGRLERQGETRAQVAAVVGAAPEQARARLGRDLARALRAVDKFRNSHLAAADDPAFPDHQQLRLAAGEDPALAAYAVLDEQWRRRDFYLFDLSDSYWISEYSWRGQPAPFKSDFIIHLGEASGRGTRLEVLEYRPRVHLGQHFVLRGHHGPGFYDDVRFVGPTTRDRGELLELLLGLLPGS